MAAQIEVELSWVANSNIHSRSSWDVVASTAAVLVIATEQASVVALLYHNERNARLVTNLKHGASFTDGTQLARKDLEWDGVLISAIFLKIKI